MRAVRGLWRWRRNALCRATDLTEAWVALAAAVLMVLAAPVAGWAVGAATREVLLETVHTQQAQRHRVPATVLRLEHEPGHDADPETSSRRDAYRRVVAVWTASDGSRRTGSLRATRPVAGPGDRFPIWTDRHGKPVARPLDGATATTHAVLAGSAAGAVVAGLVEGARRLVVWRLLRRRYAAWDIAWERAGQDWGRAGAGS
ncbi:Rv1733c family protein [Streptomyces palmae]|uniref:Uncharacterized protein n=1 Tax=Streptomyces palmae TaxID=1701085 RepID=A0A4Z0H846_9ACTN|nr:hypothetical protein [Streptomyces palmae]TGB11822.1 hypothetical protein E4099_11605 [Streptomyces palmae]